MLAPTAAAARCVLRFGLSARRVVIVVSSAVALTAAFGASGASGRVRDHHCRYAHARVGTVSRGRLQAAVVCLINVQRTTRGLPPLQQSRRLNRSAQGWTNAMVRDRFFSHGADFAARITAVGFNWSNVGENIASGFSTPAAVVRGWMGSPGHCRNILTPTFADVGTGVSRRGVPGASGHGTWTQDFGLWMGARAPSGNWGPADRCPY